MQKLTKTLIASLTMLFALSFTLSANADIPPAVNGKAVPSLAPMLKKVLPAVVNISVVGAIPKGVNPFAEPSGNAQNPNLPQSTKPKSNKQPLPRKFFSLGSGVIVNAEKGYILTNAHVIRDAKTITVTLKSGRQYKAKLIGQDPASDIAVLQIHAKNLHQVTFGDSSKLNVGDFVVAIGSPFGLSQTVTSGIVSALQRTGLGIEGYENFIQTDAPINPGNSGGALVNLQGKVVGINTAILAPDGANIGIGFAIPADMAKSVMEQLIKYGSVRRGLMGVMIQSLTPELAEAFNQPDIHGAVVTQVNPFSPAALAGFKPGDIIENVNGHKIDDAAQVTNVVGLLRVGSEIHLKILRNGKPMDISLKTASPKAYQKESQQKNPLLYGMNMQNFDSFTAIHGDVHGVQITGISQLATAFHASPVGLRPGDVIISANGKPVKNIEQLEKVAKNSKQLLLNVYRGTGAMYVVVK